MVRVSTRPLSSRQDLIQNPTQNTGQDPASPDVGVPRLSVVIPVFNEEENLQALFGRLFPTLAACHESYEVICVDDGSRDASRSILESQSREFPQLVVLRHPTNLGQHNAILTGFRHARGHWVVTIDADLQNPPEEIPALVDALQEGYDVVGTYRVGRRDPWTRRVASRSVNGLIRSIWGVEFRDIGCMLRGYTGEISRQITNRADSERQELFIPAAALQLANNPIEIPVSHSERAAGRSKYGLRQLLRLSRNIVKTLRH